MNIYHILDISWLVNSKYSSFNVKNFETNRSTSTSRFEEEGDWHLGCGSIIFYAPRNEKKNQAFWVLWLFVISKFVLFMFCLCFGCLNTYTKICWSFPETCNFWDPKRLGRSGRSTRAMRAAPQTEKLAENFFCCENWTFYCCCFGCLLFLLAEHTIELDTFLFCEITFHPWTDRNKKVYRPLPFQVSWGRTWEGKDHRSNIVKNHALKKLMTNRVNMFEHWSQHLNPDFWY